MVKAEGRPEIAKYFRLDDQANKSGNGRHSSNSNNHGRQVILHIPTIPIVLNQTKQKVLIVKERQGQINLPQQQIHPLMSKLHNGDLPDAFRLEGNEGQHS